MYIPRHQYLKSLVALMASCLICSFLAVSNAGELVWYDGTSPVAYTVETSVDPVVTTAIGMFGEDMQAVTGLIAVTEKKKSAKIRLYQLDKASEKQRRALDSQGVPTDSLSALTDGFHISVAEGKINVAGANGRGTAYGLLELSRMAGVSPWVWWGDVVPEKQDTLRIDDDFSTIQGASVEYRGIFINDEDWSLRPWSSHTFEPNEDGTIGPKTYKEIFKLLMRLRANAIWPAMHPGTTAFFKNPLNKIMADSCGIAVGTSHCEPLLRNNVDEWDVEKRGAFNYMTNRDAVQDYWAERLKEVKGSAGGNMYTIGMRGIHDGSMEGVKTPSEKFDALQQVIDDQQKLIERNIGDPAMQMQVFVPYKEVLELYEQGLKVPDYVTLMWCDDNYGYITRLSDSMEQKRSGGAGVYYHLSYWGRPHDHLWLTTTQPGLIYNEMRTAYDHNARKLWIANVHDPKVAAYDLSLFLDLAWDINCVKDDSIGGHLKNWLMTNFGKETGEKIYPLMRKFYSLTAKRKPEFMGWSQVELDKKKYPRGLSRAGDTEFSFEEFGSEAERYMEEWGKIASEVELIDRSISPELKDAYFAAVIYPVSVAACQTVKLLEAQRARQLAASDSLDEDAVRLASAKSLIADIGIKMLTEVYNKKMSEGKWDGLMDMNPRDLPVFRAPDLPVSMSDGEMLWRLEHAPQEKSQTPEISGVIARRAADYDRHEGEVRVIDMLGHSDSALSLAKGSGVVYDFEVSEKDTFRTLTVALVPSQPNDGGDLRFSVSVDGGAPTVFSLKEPFRSEQWKLNVLRGQARRTIALPELSPGRHSFKVRALDDHIVLDQWILDSDIDRTYYLIPID